MFNIIHDIINNEEGVSMIEMAKNCEKSMLATCVVSFILGIVLLVAPTQSLQLITIAIAVLFMFIGAFQIVTYLRSGRLEKMTSVSLVMGIIFLTIGLYLITNSTKLGEFITTIIGIFFTVKALFKIQYSLNLKGISDKWKYNFVTGLVNLSLGILIILQPLHSLELFLKIVGVVLIVFAIAELIETIKVMKTLDSVDVKELDFIEKTSSKKFRENYND